MNQFCNPIFSEKTPKPAVQLDNTFVLRPTDNLTPNEEIISISPKTYLNTANDIDEEKLHHPRSMRESEDIITTEHDTMAEGQNHPIQMDKQVSTVPQEMTDINEEEKSQSAALKDRKHHYSCVDDTHCDTDLKMSVLTDSLDYCAPITARVKSPGVTCDLKMLTEKTIKLSDCKFGLIRTFKKEFALFLREEYIQLDVCLHEITDSAVILRGHREHLEHDNFIEKFLLKCIKKVTNSMKQLETQLLSNTDVISYINTRLNDLQIICYWACAEDGLSIDVFSQKETMALDGVLLISQCLCKWSITVSTEELTDVTKNVIVEEIESEYKNMFIYQNLETDESDSIGYQFNFIALDSVMPEIKLKVRNAIHSCSAPYRGDMLCRPAEKIDRDFFTDLAQRYSSTVTVKEGFIAKPLQALVDRYCFLLPDNRRILIQQGSLCDSDADAILCPVDDMHCAVGVGEVVFERVGDDLIQDMFKELWKVLQKRKTLIDEDHPHVIDRYCQNVGNRCIVFAVLPNGYETDNIDTMIQKAVSHLLLQSDKHACSSVAVAIDYTTTITSQDLVTVFAKSLKKFPKQKLKFVKEFRLIVSNEDHLTCLYDVLCEHEQTLLPTSTSRHVLDLSSCQLEDATDGNANVSPIDIEVFQGSLSHSDLAMEPLHEVVCKGLLKEGGDQIKKEFDGIVTSDLRFGDTFTTGAGNFQCKKICHGVLYNRWDATGDFSLKVMRFVIIQALQQAEKEHCVSIGIPELGAGFLGYPVKQVVNVLYNTIEMYGRCHNNTCIKRVLLAVMDVDDLYKEALHDVIAFQHSRQHYGGVLFDDKSVGLNPGFDTRFHFWETVDQSTGVVVRIAPDFPIGVYFDIDIIYILKETGSPLPQGSLLPKPQFDKSDNIYKLTVETFRFQDQESGFSTTLQDCLNHAQSHKYMSVAFQLQNTGHHEIYNMSMLISNLLFKKSKRGKLSAKYSVLFNSDVDLKSITEFGGSQSQFKRKCRYTEHYMKKGMVVSVKAKNRKTYEQIRREIEENVDVITSSSSPRHQYLQL